jgi:RNA-directed DNA polymerase
MGDVVRELGHLSKLAQHDPAKRFNRLYRLLCQPEFLALAKAKVEGNHGANTPGIDGMVMGDVTTAAIDRLSRDLAAGAYQPQPVRRTYVAKKRSHKLRPLGIPTSHDKVVQAGVALILEALYEPLFRNSSHGFRPGRSTITALRQVATAYRAGATWIMEGDLADCFGSLPHGVILNCLRKRICDERFIDLIRRMLQAGIMDRGRFLPTYSGTPQGGVASPMLANVVLHELDGWMEAQCGANPPAQTSQEQVSRRNPQYQRLTHRIAHLRRYLDGKRSIPQGREASELRQELRQALRARRCVPCYLPRQGVYYARYADDFLVILCNVPKAEAQRVKERMEEWLKETLGLTLNREKTLITHWQARLRFLGYQLQGRRNMSGTHWLHLSVPQDAIQAVVAKVKQATRYPEAPEYDVFSNVNTVVRGWANYYRFAHNSTKVAGRVGSIVFWCVAHYLGHKRRQSLPRVLRQCYARDPHTGCKTLFVRKPGTATPYYLWHKPLQRLPLIAEEAAATQDVLPYLNLGWAAGHSLTQRMEARAVNNGICQGCGRKDVPLRVHHPNRLRNAKRVKAGSGNVARSGYSQQTKMLCGACHLQHHHGHTHR